MPPFVKKYFLLLGLLVFTTTLYAQPVFEDLSKEEQEIVRCFQYYMEYEFSDTLKAKKYADSGVYLSRKLGDAEYLGKAFQYQGWYEERGARYKSALNYFYKSLYYMKKAGAQQGIANA